MSLLEINADLSITLDSLQTGVVLIDKDFKVLLINKAFFTIWKAADGSLAPGDHFRKLIDINRGNGIYPVEDAAWEEYIEERLAEIAEGNVEPREFIRDDGVCLKYSVVNLGEGRRLISYVDITEQKENEERLKAEKEKSIELQSDLTTTLNSLEMAVVVVDRNLRVQLINNAFNTIWKTAEDAFHPGDEFRALMDINRHNGVYLVPDEQWEEYIQSRLEEIREGNVSPREFERADGVVLIYSVTNLSGGRRLISYYDISDQKKKENDLHEARRIAESAERAKSEFLANMSHEIRTPMNGVMGMAELLAASELDSKQAMFTDIIVKSGASLLTIINDILDFSKIDAGQMELDPEPFILGQAIEDVATLVSAKVAEKDLELIVRIDPSLPKMLVGDVGRIRQIVTNLLGNAVKFTERGHIYVNVEGEVRRNSHSEAEIAALRFEIEDTGIGIPEDKCGQVFKKFSQVDTSATRKHEGTGLGLSISSALVELMDGEIGVRSELGNGSTFWFSIDLPVHGDAVPEIAIPGDLSGARVLIIDDNSVNRSILTEQMTAWHFDCAAAASGREGLEVMRAVKRNGLDIDLVVLDYQMPQMSGADVLEAMRRDMELSNVPVVMLTSVDSVEVNRRLTSLGAEANLTKPTRSSMLLETVMQVIANNRAHLKVIMDREARPSLEDAATQTSTIVEKIESRRLDVLLAEDNEVNQMVFSQILEDAGLEFKIVGDGQLGLESFIEDRPSLVLMDVSMPRMNGKQAAAEIRKYEQQHDLGRVPIIGVTAHALKGDRESCIEAGMDDYLSKPVSPMALVDMLSKWMGRPKDGLSKRQA